MWSGPPAGRLRDLPETERAAFGKWIYHQTRPVLAGVPRSEQDGFFLHDYAAWKRESPAFD